MRPVWPFKIFKAAKRGSGTRRCGEVLGRPPRDVVQGTRGPTVAIQRKEGGRRREERRGRKRGGEGRGGKKGKVNGLATHTVVNKTRGYGKRGQKGTPKRNKIYNEKCSVDWPVGGAI